MFGLAVSASRGFSGPIYRVDQVPEHFHEHYILRGYRQPKSSISQCLLSLFDPTNETINIWTHFLPTCYFLYVTCQLWGVVDFCGDSYSWALMCYLFVCCAFPLASAVAHLFNVMSDRARHVCFFLDYSALSLFSFGVAIAYRAYCFPSSLLLSKNPVLVWYCDNYVNIAAFNAVLSTFLTCQTRFLPPSPTHKAMRLGAFAIPYFYDNIPVVYRILVPYADPGYEGETGGHQDDLSLSLGGHNLHARQFMFTGFAAFWYATHFPERLLPGVFDIVGHSHQLFHVCGILAVLDQLKAILMDFQHRREFLEGLIKHHNAQQLLNEHSAVDVLQLFWKGRQELVCPVTQEDVSAEGSWDMELWTSSLGYLAFVFWFNAALTALFTVRLAYTGCQLKHR
ncbi:membrane progestin receptor gamma [Elysia marginata]|uniref:Membrane progestin receptor gamma n=1 Tax=Elysia marginata TaxID=1093978 RepID=A0AAV4EJ03_9GAST|nr:membrane progestin receptor gamma [Elysia marginata]